MGFVDHLADRWPTLLDRAAAHAALVAAAVVLATLAGLAAAVLLRRRPRGASAAVALGAAALTVPSLALMSGLSIATGRGTAPALAALALGAAAPVLRGAVVGLRAVEPAVVAAAAGAGMGRARRLWRVELPLAWPAILAGVRVATAIALAIATVAAVVDGPGLGVEILAGLERPGEAQARDLALGGTLAVLVLAALFECAYAALRRLTVSRGLR